MTRTDRLKLAKAARELASLYAEGDGPRLNPGDWCGCAAGQTMKRAHILTDDLGREAYDLDMAFGLLLTAATWMQVEGVDYFSEDYQGHHVPMPGAVVFPLLALADELESQP